MTLTGLRPSGSITLARDDPRGFLSRCGGPVVFDETQRVPEPSSYLQTAVDRGHRPGRFVLTGSHSFHLMEQLSQILAERSGVLLRPFSRTEREGQQQEEEPKDPRLLFSNPTTGPTAWEAVRMGFYRRIHDRGIPPEVWLADHV